MARAFLRRPTLPSSAPITTKLGAVSAPYLDTEIGKFVKQSTSVDSGYVLCAAGDPIEGVIEAVEAATAAGFGIGSVGQRDMREVTFDGLQATPGTGTVALGDYVVCGTVTAKDTKLPGPPKVCKATNQPGAVPADLTAAGQMARNAIYAWRVVSLGTAGTGAVGTTGVIERLGG
jgi:hypothetical protein